MDESVIQRLPKMLQQTPFRDSFELYGYSNSNSCTGYNGTINGFKRTSVELGVEFSPFMLSMFQMLTDTAFIYQYLILP